MTTAAARAMRMGARKSSPRFAAAGDQVADTGDDRVEDRRDPASAARRFSGRQRARVVIRHRRRVPRFASEGAGGFAAAAAVECAPVAGAWLNGRAPDSGSGGSRFESWRASHPPPFGPSSRVFAAPATDVVGTGVLGDDGHDDGEPGQLRYRARAVRACGGASAASPRVLLPGSRNLPAARVEESADLPPSSDARSRA